MKEGRDRRRRSPDPLGVNGNDFVKVAATGSKGGLLDKKSVAASLHILQIFQVDAEVRDARLAAFGAGGTGGEGVAEYLETLELQE